METNCGRKGKTKTALGNGEVVHRGLLLRAAGHSPAQLGGTPARCPSPRTAGGAQVGGGGKVWEVEEEETGSASGGEL
eukprot:3933426-Rhodomonas_salina.1